MFKKQTIPMSMLTISKRVNSGVLRFDLEIQRRSCWSEEQKQNLVDSIIFDYPIPPLYFVDKQDNQWWCLDGQQRCRAISEYINDNFALKNDIAVYVDEDGTEFKVAGLKYSELSKEIQIKINSTNFNTYTFSNITDDETREVFRRLNSGEPMKKIELTRIDAGTEAMRFINDVSNMDFFKSKVNISDKAKIHFTDHEVILQTIALLGDVSIGFSGKELQQFAVDMKDGFLDEELKNKVISITDYLDKVFPEQEKVKYLKKVNIPVVFKISEKAITAGIEPVDFFEFINDFFTETISDTEYQATTESGSAKKENIQKRIQILTSEFNRKFANELQKAI